jgi:hypothetical protein
MRYQIDYNGKTYISIAGDAKSAFAKFANRKVFGREYFCQNYELEECDANTNGKKWAQYKCGWPSESQFYSICEEVK